MKIWCGPSAIAHLTGKPIAEVHAAIRAHRLEDGFGSGSRNGKGVIGWMNLDEMPRVLRRLGFHSQIAKPRPKRTLAAFLREGKFADMIVLAGHHFIAVRGDLWIDNARTHWSSLAVVPRPRSLVYGYVKVLP